MAHDTKIDGVEIAVYGDANPIMSVVVILRSPYHPASSKKDSGKHYNNKSYYSASRFSVERARRIQDKLMGL